MDFTCTISIDEFGFHECSIVFPVIVDSGFSNSKNTLSLISLGDTLGLINCWRFTAGIGFNDTCGRRSIAVVKR